MNLIALKMLMNDKAKFLALVFAIASATFLVAQQVSIFTGLMNRTTSQIKDVAPDAVWVMHPQTVYVDEIRPMPDPVLGEVRGVEGVEWAVRHSKNLARASAANGRFRVGILLGLDDATLVGVPTTMILGRVEDLRKPDAVIIDDMGYRSLFPDAPLEIGKTIELNDRRAVIVGICKPRPPFQTFPVIYAKYSDSLRYIGRERNTMSFVLAKPKAGVTLDELSDRIGRVTGMKAMPAESFAWATIWYYIGNTGIPVNFGLTIVTAIVVGAAVSGQTLYLFVLENLKAFAALKAIGASDGRLTGMVLLQAGAVGAIGFGVGIGLTAVFFESTREIPKLRMFLLYTPVALGTALVIVGIAALASVLATRTLRRLEPGVVFRG
jgi:putative ABC transport system permease protein